MGAEANRAPIGAASNGPWDCSATHAAAGHSGHLGLIADRGDGNCVAIAPDRRLGTIQPDHPPQQIR